MNFLDYVQFFFAALFGVFGIGFLVAGITEDDGILQIFAYVFSAALFTLALFFGHFAFV